MAKKLVDQTLEELYEKPKISPTVEKLIWLKDDFSKVNNRYCDKVCKYPTKCTTGISLAEPELGVDIIIVQNHSAPPEKFKSAYKAENITQSILRHIMTKHGPNCSWRVLNAIKCGPVNEGQKVSDRDIKKCGPYLRSELQRLKPKVIVCLDTSAAKVIGTNKSVFSSRGEIHASPYGPVVHTIHPRSLVMLRQNASGAMWGPDYFSCLEIDLKKAISIAKGESTPVFDLAGSIAKYKEGRITICRTIQDVAKCIEVINALPPTRVISFDTETTGLDPFAIDAKLLCIQFGWVVNKEEFACVIPLWHRENKEVNPNAAWELVEPLLLSARPKVAHNGKFDIKYIYCTKGIRVANVVFDTMLLLHEFNSGIQGNYGLKRAAWDYMWETGIAGYEDLLPKLTKEEDEPDETDISDQPCEL